MKIQFADKRAIENIAFELSISHPGELKKRKKALAKAVWALEKQIPMKAHCEYDTEFDCPACGETTEDYDVTALKFCPECGQKLE